MTPRFAGLDPGRNGAVVVIAADGQTVLDVQQWHRARVPPTLTVLAGVQLLVVEGQHVSSKHASLVLAEWCGRLLASLPPDLEVLRPTATSWRAKVFRSTRLQRDPAKRLAIAAAAPHLAAFGITDPSHDLAEAWAMARYAAFYPQFNPSEIPA